MIQYVVCYAKSSNGLVPLILKNKPKHLEGMWNLPGGKLEKDETPVAGGLRELKEETGLVGKNPEYMGCIHGGTCEIHCIKMQVKNQALVQGPGETEKVAWFFTPELFSLPNLMPNLRLTIPLMQNCVAGWVIQDFDPDWRENVYHNVCLILEDDTSGYNPLKVQVRSVGWYKNEDQ